MCSGNRFVIQENKQNEKSPKLKKRPLWLWMQIWCRLCFVRNWKPFGARIAQQSGGEQSWHLSNCFLANDCDSSSLENRLLLSVCWNTQRHRDARLNVLHFLLMIWSFSWWVIWPLLNLHAPPIPTFSFLESFNTLQSDYEVRPHPRGPPAQSETWCWPVCHAIIVLMPLIINIVG